MELYLCYVYLTTQAPPSCQFHFWHAFCEFMIWGAAPFNKNLDGAAHVEIPTQICAQYAALVLKCVAPKKSPMTYSSVFHLFMVSHNSTLVFNIMRILFPPEKAVNDLLYGGPCISCKNKINIS